MDRIMNKYRMFFVLLLLPVMALAAGDTGMAALKIGVSARASAMGESFSAVADDASGLFWNPAGTAWAVKRQAGFTYNQWIQDISHQTAGMVIPTSHGSFGLGLMLNSMDGFERRTIASDEPLGTFSTQDLALVMNYSRKVGERMSLGANVRYLYEKIYIETSSGYAVDLGARYRLMEGLYAGAAVQNLGSMSEMAVESLKLPRTIRAGAAWYVPVGSNPQNLLLSLDYVDYQGDGGHVHTGVEYSPVSAVSLRAGYQTGYEERSLSAGFGLKFSVFMLDYAYVPFSNDLGNSQRFSVSVDF